MNSVSLHMSCFFKERHREVSEVPSCVVQIMSSNPLRLSVSLPPGHAPILTRILALNYSTAEREVHNPALCSIKGSLPGGKHRERTGEQFHFSGAQKGDLLTAARVAKSPWQLGS